MTQECDMLGKTDFDCVPEGYSPIEWDKICKEFQEDEIRVLREGMIQKEEKTIANDGTVKWFRTTKKLVEVYGEQYIYGESVDISKEKEGVEKLNLLLKNNPFSMYFKDKQ